MNKEQETDANGASEVPIARAVNKRTTEKLREERKDAPAKKQVMPYVKRYYF